MYETFGEWIKEFAAELVNNEGFLPPLTLIGVSADGRVVGLRYTSSDLLGIPICDYKPDGSGSVPVSPLTALVVDSRGKSARKTGAFFEPGGETN